MKSKKGTSQAETILYLFFAVVFIMIGILSVKSYLINAELNKDLQLSNLDFGVISNRILSSDNCIGERQTVTLNDGEADYNVHFIKIGNIVKSKVTDSKIEECLKGFDKGKYKTLSDGTTTFVEGNYKIKLSELLSDGTRTALGNLEGYGTHTCQPKSRKGEFLIGVKGSSTGLGVLEICIA